ncbi:MULTISPECIES: histidine phosphatase family protein [unclassified Rhodococcus (in: high G+C Gram-positive bacteria)]|uniref:histidine phosphatase family protein n=1 Tax=unclassified Rhodococcus (in: high G+C Gram-positive bacteria) TaxID=192944 RepID=UPI001358D6DB|nr:MULTISPECIES: histidine phosphatase family protein [unclassified Rhodococcus (in: high G+C Gram-positive bacteria)]
MQLLFIRHALPELVTTSEGRADPALTEDGRAQAKRLPAALGPYRIARIVSSPQRRALETAAPLAEALNLPVTQDQGLAEYDYDLDHYIPFHEAEARAPEAYARIRAGQFPPGIDADAFRTRVFDALGRVVQESDHRDTVAIFAHGGVINVYLQELLGLDRPLVFPIEYVSVTRVLVSRSGERRVASVNETGHVRDMLRR